MGALSDTSIGNIALDVNSDKGRLRLACSGNRPEAPLKRRRCDGNATKMNIKGQSYSVCTPYRQTYTSVNLYTYPSSVANIQRTALVVISAEIDR